jgi:DNA-binding protein H-NS
VNRHKPTRYLLPQHQQDTLEGESKMDERKRDSMIAYLRRRMAQVGIKVGDLAAALAEERKRVKATRYSNAFGDTWDGQGEMPQWLKQATSAGQSLEHFVAKKKKTAPIVSSERPAVDWSRDPFAGTRLATVRGSLNAAH